MVGILNLLLTFSVLNFIFYILFLLSLKGKSPNKILTISSTVTVLAVTIISFILYLNGTSYEDIGNKKNYVAGQVASLKNGEITLRIIAKNIEMKNKNNYITIKLDSETHIYAKSGIFERRVSYSNLSIGDVILVLCNEDQVNNNYVTPSKITIK